MAHAIDNGFGAALNAPFRLEARVVNAIKSLVVLDSARNSGYLDDGMRAMGDMLTSAIDTSGMRLEDTMRLRTRSSVDTRSWLWAGGVLEVALNRPGSRATMAAMSEYELLDYVLLGLPEYKYLATSAAGDGHLSARQQETILKPMRKWCVAAGAAVAARSVLIPCGRCAGTTRRPCWRCWTRRARSWTRSCRY